MSENPEKKLYLLDAFALIFRSYYAFINNPLINSKGMNVSAITGFVNTMHDLMKKEKPTHFAVVFDTSDETTERAQEFSFYKANRQKTPEDIMQSIPIIKDIVDAFNIPRLELGGFEADDIIGTIAKQKEKEGYKVYMVTPDKDFAQLVSENIFMYKPGRKGKPAEILGVPEILEKWEIDRPEQVIDILGMWGDAVDNIPGIPGIGEKTAKKLVKQYGSMEGLFENVDQLKGKQKENVENFKEQGLISKQLATIILNVPVEVSNEDLLICDPDKEKLSAIFAELEFRTVGKRILGEDYSVNVVEKGQQLDIFATNTVAGSVGATEVVSGKNLDNTEHKYKLVQSLDEISSLVETLAKQKQFAFDTETTGLDPIEAELVGMSFSFEEGKGYYVPCTEDFNETRTLVSYFIDLFEDESILKIGQNIKYDIKVLHKYGVYNCRPVFDTMLAHYVIEPGRKNSMDYLAETYLGYTTKSIESLIGKKGKGQKTMRDVPVEDVKEYASEDADITLQLFNHFKPLVTKHGMDELYNDIEIPLVNILADMECEGVNLDSAYLSEFSKELEKDIFESKKQIREISGVEFNLDSPKQLGEVLFTKMEIPYKGKKTKTGQFSTNEDTMQKLVKEHPIAKHIMDYRGLTKLKSTYVDALPNLVSKRTGRLHTTFNQTLVPTGRLSSLNPNLQNIPIRTERGRQVRKAFIPRDENHVFIAADYSQVELRLVAALSEDKTMMEAFKNNEDIHTKTAAKVFGVEESEVSREMRSNAKVVNFGIIYGVSAFGLSQQTTLSRTESKEIIEAYFATYPGIKKYMDDNQEYARQNGYVKTIKGRKRYLKDINSQNAIVRGHAERNAINSPVQGSAADLVKVAMINIYNELNKRNLKTKMTLQVHDELIFDAPKAELDEVKILIKEKMEDAIKLSVPVIAEVGVGNNWLEAH